MSSQSDAEVRSPDRDDWTILSVVAEVLDALEPGDLVTYGEVWPRPGIPGRRGRSAASCAVLTVSSPGGG